MFTFLPQQRCLKPPTPTPQGTQPPSDVQTGAALLGPGQRRLWGARVQERNRVTFELQLWRVWGVSCYLDSRGGTAESGWCGGGVPLEALTQASDLGALGSLPQGTLYLLLLVFSE